MFQVLSLSFSWLFRPKLIMLQLFKKFSYEKLLKCKHRILLPVKTYIFNTFYERCSHVWRREIEDSFGWMRIVMMSHDLSHVLVQKICGHYEKPQWMSWSVYQSSRAWLWNVSKTSRLTILFVVNLMKERKSKTKQRLSGYHETAKQISLGPEAFPMSEILISGLYLKSELLLINPTWSVRFEISKALCNKTQVRDRWEKLD